MASGIETLIAVANHVTLRVNGEVLHVTINRPDARNALHAEAHCELARAFDAFASDRSLRIAVIRGTGEKAFCAGSDLKAKTERAKGELPDSGFAGLTHRFDLDKPVIAAVNGYALGGGLEIVLACDLAVAVESAEFGFPEPLVGLAAMSGGIQRAVRHIPSKHAMGMLLTGRRIDAGTALELGLINEVVASSELDRAIDRWVSQVLRCAPLAIQATKQVARETLEQGSLAEAIQREYPAVTAMLGSHDALEGPRAFSEKRAPVWKGR